MAGVSMSANLPSVAISLRVMGAHVRVPMIYQAAK